MKFLLNLILFIPRFVLSLVFHIDGRVRITVSGTAKCLADERLLNEAAPKHLAGEYQYHEHDATITRTSWFYRFIAWIQGVEVHHLNIDLNNGHAWSELHDLSFQKQQTQFECDVVGQENATCRLSIFCEEEYHPVMKLELWHGMDSPFTESTAT